MKTANHRNETLTAAATPGRGSRDYSVLRRLLLCGLLTVAAGPLALAAEEPPEAFPVLTWTPVFQGISRSEFTLTSPRTIRAFALKIDLKAPGIEFLATPDNGEKQGETDSQQTSTFLKSNNLQAAINASPFAPVVNTEGRPENVSGLHVSQGTIVSPAAKEGCPALVLTKDNRARMEANPAARAGDAWNAVSGFSIVLKGGQPVAGSDDLHPRTAAGISADGGTLIWLVVDGRQKNYSGGAKTAELGAWLKAMGCSEGINLDGGGTSTLVLAGSDGPQIINRPIHLGVPGKERPSGSHLGVRAKPLDPAGAAPGRDPGTPAEQHFSTLLHKEASPGAKAKAMAALTGMHGDAKSGEDVFGRACFTCHVVNDFGAHLGPDLSDAGKRLSRLEIADAVINPDAKVDAKYYTVTLTARDGEEFTGFVENEDDTAVTLRMGAELLQKIDRRTITKRDTVKTSTMTGELAATLSAQEFVDLIEYLAAQK